MCLWLYMPNLSNRPLSVFIVRSQSKPDRIMFWSTCSVNVLAWTNVLRAKAVNLFRKKDRKRKQDMDKLLSSWIQFQCFNSKFQSFICNLVFIHKNFCTIMCALSVTQCFILCNIRRIILIVLKMCNVDLPDATE